MQEQLLRCVDQAILAAQQLRTPQALAFIEAVALRLAQVYEEGGKLLVAGNGGSLCDAMHFAEEMTGQFRFKRRALPAIALSDASHITCVGNDYGYDQVFSRGVEALGNPGDMLVVLTTSGNSPNIVRAVEMAKERGLVTVAFLGKDGGKMRGLADLEWIVSGFPFSDRIQEAHMAAIHILIEQVEHILFKQRVSVG